MRNNWTSMMVGLLLPAAQSIVTGVLTFLASWPIAAAMKPSVDLGDPLTVAAAVGTSVALIMWINLRSRWHSALETVLNVDLNMDGRIGSREDVEEDYPAEEVDEPVLPIPASIQAVKVFVKSDDRHTTIFKMPIEKERFEQVAALLLSRGTFTYGDFSGPGKLLLRREYETIRGELVDRGILERSGKSAIPTLTRAGRATMRAIVEGKLNGTSK